MRNSETEEKYMAELAIEAEGRSWANQCVTVPS